MEIFMPQASYTTCETLQTLCHLAERDMLKSNKNVFLLVITVVLLQESLETY